MLGNNTYLLYEKIRRQKQKHIIYKYRGGKTLKKQLKELTEVASGD